jgi:hypothetical protein
MTAIPAVDLSRRRLDEHTVLTRGGAADSIGKTGLTSAVGYRRDVAERETTTRGAARRGVEGEGNEESRIGKVEVAMQQKKRR